MGSKFAPIYATLVLAYLEEKVYEQSAKEFDSDFRGYLEANFKRFLDDCFLIFTRTEEQLMKFYNLLNSLHPSIKFTLEKSKTRLPFLDTLEIKAKPENFKQTFTTNQQIQNSIFFTSHINRNIQEIAFHTI